MREQRELSVPIARPFAEVAAFLAQPLNYPLWAAGLGNGLRHDDAGWWVQTPQGEMRVQFSEANAEGIADHVVYPPNAAPVQVPLRVLDRGAGCEVVLTLIPQPPMSDADFEADAQLVRRDLQTLKTLLESR